MLKARWIILGFFALWAVVIAGAFLKYSLSEEKIFSNPHNKRVLIKKRGRILDRNNKILAYSDDKGRKYPLGAAACHVVGYVNAEVGSASGIEADYGQRLLSGKKPNMYYFVSRDSEGIPLKTTLDAKLQLATDSALGSRQGAFVVMKIKTGEILAEGSHPAYDPNTIGSAWKRLSSESNGVLVNRAANGHFPPGSVWKIITAINILDKKVQEKDFVCTGSLAVGGKTYHCEARHGHIGLREAFARSCNLYFIHKGMNGLKREDFVKTSEMFMSRPLRKDPTETEQVLGFIGQGLDITPMEGMLLAATIANNGLMPKPVLVKEGLSSRRVLSEETAKEMQKLMIEVVKKGTGKNLSRFLKQGYVLGLKTGTAEKDVKGNVENVTWMVGFAGRKSPEIAFAVVVDHSRNFASEECSPVVSSMLTTYFANTKEK